jgi:hypothetical protein
MGLSLVEMAIGKFPIPPPSKEEVAGIFAENAEEEHMNAAIKGIPLKGNELRFLDDDFHCCEEMCNLINLCTFYALVRSVLEFS